MKSNARININKVLKKALEEYVKGHVLEIGVGNLDYINNIENNYLSYKTLDIDKKLDVDFCEDIHKTTIPGNQFDTIIMIEVLEHLYNPFKAIEEVHRIARTNANVIATTPFIHPYHGEPHDYFRFTEYGLRKIFENFSKVEIISYGNLFGALLDLSKTYKIFKPLSLINPLINNCFNYSLKEKTPIGNLVIAVK